MVMSSKSVLIRSIIHPDLLCVHFSNTFLMLVLGQTPQQLPTFYILLCPWWS